MVKYQESIPCATVIILSINKGPPTETLVTYNSIISNPKYNQCQLECKSSKYKYICANICQIQHLLEYCGISINVNSILVFLYIKMIL